MKVFQNYLAVTAIMIAFVVFSWFLKWISVFAIPLVFGLILGLVFAPLLHYFMKKKIALFFSILLIVMLFMTLSVIFSSLMVVSPLYNMGDNFSAYQEKVVNIIQVITQNVSFINSSLLVDWQTKLFDYLEANIYAYSRSFLQYSLKFTSQYLIVIFSMIFVLLERSLLDVKIGMLYEQDSQSKNKLITLISDINTQVSRFIVLKTLISLATGLIIYVGFGLIGVEFKFLWALLTFLFNFIPTVGSMIITILSVTFAFVQFFPDFLPVLFVIILTISTQTIVGNILDPKVMGDNLNLSPLVIWISLLYWGWMWGAAGALLAIPIAVIVRAICEYIPILHSLGLFMGNSRALQNKQIKLQKLASEHTHQEHVEHEPTHHKNKMKIVPSRIFGKNTKND